MSATANTSIRRTGWTCARNTSTDGDASVAPTPPSCTTSATTVLAARLRMILNPSANAATEGGTANAHDGDEGAKDGHRGQREDRRRGRLTRGLNRRCGGWRASSSGCPQAAARGPHTRDVERASSRPRPLTRRTAGIEESPGRKYTVRVRDLPLLWDRGFRCSPTVRRSVRVSENSRFTRKPSSFREATAADKINAEARARVQDIKERLEREGFSKVQADFSVMPVQRHGFTKVGEVRAYMQRTRPGIFKDDDRG